MQTHTHRTHRHTTPLGSQGNTWLSMYLRLMTIYSTFLHLLLYNFRNTQLSSAAQWKNLKWWFAEMLPLGLQQCGWNTVCSTCTKNTKTALSDLSTLHFTWDTFCFSLWVLSRKSWEIMVRQTRHKNLEVDKNIKEKSFQTKYATITAKNTIAIQYPET